MKLSKWAKQQGICYKTAIRWFHAGKIPGAEQMPSGTILVRSQSVDKRGQWTNEEIAPRQQLAAINAELRKLLDALDATDQEMQTFWDIVREWVRRNPHGAERKAEKSKPVRKARILPAAERALGHRRFGFLGEGSCFELEDDILNAPCPYCLPGPMQRTYGECKNFFRNKALDRLERYYKERGEQEKLFELRQTRAQGSAVCGLPPAEMTDQIVAERFNVSVEDIYEGQKVKDASPEVFEEMKAGKLTLPEGSAQSGITCVVLNCPQSPRLSSFLHAKRQVARTL